MNHQKYRAMVGWISEAHPPKQAVQLCGCVIAYPPYSQKEINYG